MRVWIILMAAFSALSGVITNWISRAEITRRQLLLGMLVLVFFIAAAKQFENAAMAPTVVYRDSTPPPCEATLSNPSSLTKIEPPADKMPGQNVSPPIPPIDTARQRELTLQRLAAERAFAKQQDDEKKQRVWDWLDRKFGAPHL